MLLALGDSNTQGIENTSWSEEMNIFFEKGGLNATVINAGVVGYSSYQGLLKFSLEMNVVSPTHVAISFGWNDASPTIGIEDKLFLRPQLPFDA